MSADAPWALQKSVYQTLFSDSGLKALIGDPPRLYDDVPEDPVYPYLSLGEVQLSDWSTASDTGLEQRLSFHAFSRYGGRKEVQEILTALYLILHDAALSVDGNSLVTLRFEFAQILRESDGETFHGVARYRARTEAA